MKKTVILFFLLCPLFLSISSLQAKSRLEVKIRYLLAKELADMGKWCLRRGLHKEGLAYLKEAEGLESKYSRIDKIRQRYAKKRKKKSYADKLFSQKKKREGRRLASLYLKLYTLKHKELSQWPGKKKKKKAKKHRQLQVQYDTYLLAAFRHYPKKVEKILDGEIKKIEKEKNWSRLDPLLTGAREIKKKEAWKRLAHKIEIIRASRTPLLKKASSHPMKYYLVLPQKWTPKKKWDIIVGVEGAGSNFYGYARGLLRQRKDRPFILVVPHTFSSTNKIIQKKYKYSKEVIEKWDQGVARRIQFDSEGLLAVLKDVRQKYKGKEKFFITGFSGGGNLTWNMILCHPEKVAGAVPACANFYLFYKIPNSSEKKGARENLPIQAFQGSKDKYLGMLNRQWKAAKSKCDQLGYQKVKRKMLPGVGHSSCQKQALEYFESLR